MVFSALCSRVASEWESVLGVPLGWAGQHMHVHLQPREKFRNNVDLTRNVLRTEIDIIRDMQQPVCDQTHQLLFLVVCLLITATTGVLSEKET